jgi:hypothetical protein
MLNCQNVDAETRGGMEIGGNPMWGLGESGVSNLNAGFGP